MFPLLAPEASSGRSLQFRTDELCRPSDQAAARRLISKNETDSDFGQGAQWSPLQHGDASAVSIDEAVLEQAEGKRSCRDAGRCVFRIARRFGKLPCLETAFGLILDRIRIEPRRSDALAALFGRGHGGRQIVQSADALYGNEGLHTRRDGILERQIEQVVAGQAK